MTEYLGHVSWNIWNIGVWIRGNEGLYFRAAQLVQKHGRKKAAKIMAAEMKGEKTPDGGKYNQTAIFAAMDGMSHSF